MRQYVTKERLDEIKQETDKIIDKMGMNDYKNVSGLYFIKIYDKIVYIGSSKTDLAYRIARHKMHLLDPNDEPELKYDVMREVYNRDPNIWQVIIQPLPAADCTIEEYKLIDKYKPIFNEKYAIYEEGNGYFPVGYCYIDKKEYPNAEEVWWYLQTGDRDRKFR